MQYKKLASTRDLPPGTMIGIEISEDRTIVLVNLHGTIHALESECTHFGADLSKGVLCENHIRCPWHQAVFDAETGHVLEPPALDNIAHYEVRIEGEDIIAALPDEFAPSSEPDMAEFNPDSDPRDFVILGTGAAGMSAAQTLRQKGFQGRIFMATVEKDLPYDRTSLSKGLLKSKEDKAIPLLRPEEFYQKHGIEILMDHCASAIDTKTHVVYFANQDKKLKYNALLLAVGSLPRILDIPGADLPGVFTLRSWRDFLNIREQIKNARHAVMIGASFIAMECAASMRNHDIEVTVIAPEEVPFERVLGREVGRLFEQVHRKNGVDFHLNMTVNKIEKKADGLTLTLDNGSELRTDIVLMGVGVRPATRAIQGLNLREDGGVNTDVYLRAAPDVFAAGDIAAWPDFHSGDVLRIEHWRHAQQQGAAAAANMLGEMIPYHKVPFFWTNQYKTSLRYAGFASDWDDIIIKGDVESARFIAFYVKNGGVLAAAGCGADQQMAAAAELLYRENMPRPAELRSSDIDLYRLLHSIEMKTTA